MKVNGYDVVDWKNRPAVLQRVGIRIFAINDGELQDFNSVSALTIHNHANNLYPSSILTSSQLVSATPLMAFGNSSVDPLNVAFNVSNYTPGTNASGIFRLGTGQYIGVLDGTVALSGAWQGSVIKNAASSTGNYIAVWTVKQSTGSDWKTIINPFELFDDTFFVITEPLLLRTSHILAPKTIKIGSKVELKVGTEVTVENKNIDASIKNIFKDSYLTSALMEIKKINDAEPNLPARVTVSSFTNSTNYVDVTSDNTIIFVWDTSLLATHAETLAGNLGSLTGIYSVQVKYNLFNELIYSDLMYVKVI